MLEAATDDVADVHAELDFVGMKYLDECGNAPFQGQRERGKTRPIL